MRVFQYWWYSYSCWYHEYALQVIDPLHPDVPYIVRTINRLKNQIQEVA